MARKNKTLVVPTPTEGKAGALFPVSIAAPPHIQAAAGYTPEKLALAIEAVKAAAGDTPAANLPLPGIVVPSPGGGERGWDIISFMMNQSKIIFVEGEVNAAMSFSVRAQLMFLQAADVKEVTMYINSPGGSVLDGMAMYDVMELVKSKGMKIKTICNGIAMSMGSVLLCAGSPGMRSAAPHAKIMIHQPSGGAQGTFRDMSVRTQFSYELENELYRIYERHTGIPATEMAEFIRPHDYFLTTHDAKRMGLIDHVYSEATHYSAPKRSIPADLQANYKPKLTHIKDLAATKPAKAVKAAKDTPTP